MRCGEHERSTIILTLADGTFVSRIVLATSGPEACGNWDLKIETICLSRNFQGAPVKVKSATQALSMLSSVALGMALVGCTEEAPPATPAATPAPAVAPAKPGRAMAPAARPRRRKQRKRSKICQIVSFDQSDRGSIPAECGRVPRSGGCAFFPGTRPRRWSNSRPLDDRVGEDADSVDTDLHQVTLLQAEIVGRHNASAGQ